MKAPESLEMDGEVAIIVPGGACDSVRRNGGREKKNNVPGLVYN